MKKIVLLFSAICFAAQAHADDGIIRNADGSVKRMNYYEALNACPTGTHLASFRELAQAAQVRGAKGILEESQVDLEHVPTGYESYIGLNANGQRDGFYFNSEGYQRTSGDFSDNWFWSPSLSIFDHTAVVVFRADVGRLYACDIVDSYVSPLDYSKLAALCLPGR